jgi:hypothetical protein
VRNERDDSGALGACRGPCCAGMGAPNQVCAAFVKGEIKGVLRCPGVPGALSVARRLPPRETVFRGRGISSRV